MTHARGVRCRCPYSHGDSCDPAVSGGPSTANVKGCENNRGLERECPKTTDYGSGPFLGPYKLGTFFGPGRHVSRLECSATPCARAKGTHPSLRHPHTPGDTWAITQ